MSGSKESRADAEGLLGSPKQYRYIVYLRYSCVVTLLDLGVTPTYEHSSGKEPRTQGFTVPVS